MPLWLLGVVVVVGLAVILAALFLFGFNHPIVLTPDSAEREFAADNPGKITQRTLVAENGQAALIDADKRYVLWTMGADTASWALTGARCWESPAGLILRLPDYAAPRVRLTLTQNERRHWKTLIEDAA